LWHFCRRTFPSHVKGQDRRKPQVAQKNPVLTEEKKQDKELNSQRSESSEAFVGSFRREHLV